MASPMAQTSPEAPVASTPASAGPSVHSSPSRSAGKSSSKPPITRPASASHPPHSAACSRSRARHSSASTRFPVAVDGASFNRIPPLPTKATTKASKRYARIFKEGPEEKQSEGDCAPGAMPMGLENFDVGEVSDEGGADSPAKAKTEKTGESKEKRNRDKGEGKERDVRAERETNSEGKQKGETTTMGKIDSKGKGKEVLRALLSPLQAEVTPIMHPRVIAGTGTSREKCQQQRDPGHKRLKLSQPSQEFIDVDLEAQTERKNTEVCSLWQIATAMTMMFNIITFILVAAILWTITNKG